MFKHTTNTYSFSDENHQAGSNSCLSVLYPLPFTVTVLGHRFLKDTSSTNNRISGLKQLRGIILCFSTSFYFHAKKKKKIICVHISLTKSL